MEEVENEDVEGTGIVDEMVNLADDENGCEEGPSHLSVDDENDHEWEVLDLVGDESEIEQEVFDLPESGYVYVYECGCRRSGCVCGIQRSGGEKTRLRAFGFAFVFPSARLSPCPTWLGR